MAGATPPGWQYWDENLLQGRPPFAPMPEVVGISVHLTFARRAYALAVGDGVQLWPRILADVERGALAPRYEATWCSARGG